MEFAEICQIIFVVNYIIIWYKWYIKFANFNIKIERRKNIVKQKNIIRMLIIALAMVAIIFINNNSVYATAEEKIEENEVKKVVKYDVTIEVNLEMINNLLRSSNSNEMAYSTESYTPEIINKKSEYVPRIIGYNRI